MKNNLHNEMSLIVYVHVIAKVFVANNKNICKIRKNQGKKLHNLFLNNSYHNSVTTNDPNKVIFNYSFIQKRKKRVHQKLAPRLLSNLSLQETIDFVLNINLKTKPMLIIFQKTYSVSYIVRPCLNQCSLLIKNVGMGSALDQHLPIFFFVFMKKIGFKIVLLNFKLLPIEGTWNIYSYFFAQNITSENKII